MTGKVCALFAAMCVVGVAAAAEEEVTIGMGDFRKALRTVQEADIKTVKMQLGYSGGFVKKPKYGQVMRGGTGHAEVLNIIFDPSETPLKRILEVFWHSHDPTTLHQQGDDIGSQYRSVLFFRNAQQNETMHAAKAAHAKELSEAAVKNDEEGDESKVKSIVTEIVEFEKFWPAEDDLSNIAPKVEDEIRKEHAAFIAKYQAANRLIEEGDPNLVEQKKLQEEESKVKKTDMKDVQKQLKIEGDESAVADE